MAWLVAAVMSMVPYLSAVEHVESYGLTIEALPRVEWHDSCRAEGWVTVTDLYESPVPIIHLCRKPSVALDAGKLSYILRHEMVHVWQSQNSTLRLYMELGHTDDIEAFAEWVATGGTCSQRSIHTGRCLRLAADVEQASCSTTTAADGQWFVRGDTAASALTMALGHVCGTADD